MRSSLAHRQTHQPRFLSLTFIYSFMLMLQQSVYVPVRVSVSAVKSSLFSSSRFMHLSNISMCGYSICVFVGVRSEICV